MFTAQQRVHNGLQGGGRHVHVQAVCRYWTHRCPAAHVSIPGARASDARQNKRTNEHENKRTKKKRQSGDGAAAAANAFVVSDSPRPVPLLRSFRISFLACVSRFLLFCLAVSAGRDTDAPDRVCCLLRRKLNLGGFSQAFRCSRFFFFSLSLFFPLRKEAVRPPIPSFPEPVQSILQKGKRNGRRPQAVLSRVADSPSDAREDPVSAPGHGCSFSYRTRGVGHHVFALSRQAVWDAKPDDLRCPALATTTRIIGHDGGVELRVWRGDAAEERARGSAQSPKSVEIECPSQG